jgi:uncharacterized protein
MGGHVDTAKLEGVDAVVHLAGEPIGGRALDRRDQARILESGSSAPRCSRGARGARRPPAVLVSGSAVGYYGDRGDEVLTEDSSAGDDFLAEVCIAWEAAAAPAAEAGIRVVHPAPAW